MISNYEQNVYTLDHSEVGMVQQASRASRSSMSIRGVIKIVLLLEIVASKEDLRATRTKRTFIASVLLQRILLVL
jgi:hypothetical protein